MKNTAKKIVSLVLCAAMAVTLVLSLASCSSDKYDADKQIFIGATGPLTGDASSYGISVQNGAKLAIKEINEAGGFNGITLYFDMKDDKAAAGDASTGYDMLVEAGMQISLGSVTSGSCEAFAKKANTDKLLFMTPSASAANVIADRPYAYRVCFGDPDQGVLAAQNLAANYTNIGVIYDTSDDYSSSVYAAFSAEMTTLGKTCNVQTFDAENKKDFSTQVEALKSCDVIFLPIYYTEAGLIAKTASQKGCTAVLFGCDGLDGIKDQIDSTVTNKIKYITPFDVNSSDATVKKFVDAYKAEYNETPDQFAADAYDAVMALFEAMKKADIKDATISAKDLAVKVAEVLSSNDFKFKGATGEITWNAAGEPTKVPQIVELG
ncbi:MAG: ABC transporter substrate-binding protein [Eubacteriales bacterium]|nr:ABC transporter substrate-binding protein [Eubacteriales bacterium]